MLQYLPLVLSLLAASASAAAGKPAPLQCQTDWRGLLPPPGEKDTYVRVTSGEVLGLTIYVDFPDERGQLSRFEIEPFLNLPNGYRFYENKCSVFEYFRDVSQGRLLLRHAIPNTWYTAQDNKASYDVPGGARRLILEALQWLEGRGEDFSRFDSNGDGYIDALSCLFTGVGRTIASSGLSPHAGGSIDFEADGVRARRYQIMPISGALNVAMFVHEVGHMMFGWPDVYDGNFDSAGIGEYCLMAYGTYPGDPIHPCAYFKNDVGWSVTTVLTGPAINLMAEHPAFTVYKFPHPYKTNEYFLIENRQRVGRDARIPDSGLAIWHIDENGSNRNQQMTPELHYRISLEQADGRFDLERNVGRGDSTDLYKAPALTLWNTTTVPDSRWWDGSESGIGVYGVSATGPLMSFSFSYEPGVTPVEPIVFSAVAGAVPEDLAAIFTLENPSDAVEPWTITCDKSWLAPTQLTEGTIEPGASVETEVAVVADEVNELALGAHTATVSFFLPELDRWWARRVILNLSAPPRPASADVDGDWAISLGELLRVIQLMNWGAYHLDAGTEDGFAPGDGPRDGNYHDSDYNPADWRISLSELLRVIQFYNSEDRAYSRDPSTEDGLRPGR